MSLKQAVEKQPENTRRRCGVHDWILTLPADEQEFAHQLLADERRTATYIHDAFVAEGFALQSNVVRLHRNGRCACESR
jgi:hypothetical protein